MSGILLAGDVYFNRRNDAGVLQGAVYLFDAKKFEITEPVTPKPRESRGRNTYGQTKDAVYIKGGSQLAIEGDEISGAVLSMALMGELSTITQASGTATDSVVGLKLNSYIQLPHRNLVEGSTVLTNSAGTTTYALGTDYEVLPHLGWIMAKTAGAAAADNKLSYSYGTADGERIQGGTKSSVRGEIVLDGINLANRRPLVLTAWDASLAPSGAIDLASGEYVKAALQGLLNTPVGKAAPYQIDYLAA